MTGPTHDPSMLATLRWLTLDADEPVRVRRWAVGEFNRAVRENELAVEPLVVEGIGEDAGTGEHNADGEAGAR